MAIAGRLEMRCMIALGLAILSFAVDGTISHQIDVGRRGGPVTPVQTTTCDGGVTVFDVTHFGAKGDGKTDNTLAFMQAWIATCKNITGPSKLLVPEGSFVVGPVVFQGPCASKVPVVVEVKGNVIATTDLSEYEEDQWILFEMINGLIVTGGGTFDGKGDSVWKYNDCKHNKDCARLPSSIKFQKVNNFVVHCINSLNSKYFHFHITDCCNYTAYNVNISAPGTSPNTDGMHISNTNLVNVSNTVVGTGDDCISIGQGVTNARFSQITCGPGHGLSVGSLGKVRNEADVDGIFFSNCTISKATNGVRIKSWAGSQPSKASNIVFEDIIMDSVENPIIIDQKYSSSQIKEPSHVKISNVRYKNIRGTSASDKAINLLCSSSDPCDGIEFIDIDLAYNGVKKLAATNLSSCLNANFTTCGKLNPPPCQ